jgi:hypothetical protein
MTVSRVVDADRGHVWSLLADGWTYSQWVVGNSRMRAVDDHWPQTGSAIEHSIGVWPLVVNDSTTVEQCVPGEELVLLAALGPVGAARITMRLADENGGCLVEMSEVPVRGPMSLLPNMLALIAISPRNRECLWRLAALAEGR